MSVLKEVGVHHDRSTDPMWWSMAALVGLASLLLPLLLVVKPGAQVVVSESALFFTGALIGCLRPDRVWRWGVATLGALAVRDLALLAIAPRISFISNREIWWCLLNGSPLYLIHLLFVLAGAYVGSYTMRADVRQTEY